MAGRGEGKRGDRSITELDRRIGGWVRHNREAIGISMRDLAAQLTARHPQAPWQESRVKRVELAQSRLTYDDVHAILDALGVSPTLVYQQAELVERSSTTEQAILADPELSSRDRGVLLRTYQALKDS
ncbi:MAG: helix-turn-helix domain-containing protein [Acidimicrobiia bacterium]|nr:helix-turn-helix domain-containing protein [Acidimicrobiia bacterium]